MVFQYRRERDGMRRVRDRTFTQLSSDVQCEVLCMDGRSMVNGRTEVYVCFKHPKIVLKEKQERERNAREWEKEERERDGMDEYEDFVPPAF